MSEHSPRRHPRKEVVGGSREAEYTLPPQEVPANLIDTVGELRRLLLPLKNLSLETLRTNGDTKTIAHIEEVLIPQLQERVASLTGVPEATEAITLEKVLTAIQDIESGKAASYEFAHRIARSINREELAKQGVRITRSDISDAPDFEDLWQYVRNAKTDTLHDGQTADETSARQRVEQFVESVLESKGFKKSAGTDLFFREDIEILRIRNAALALGTGLQATASRLLNTTRVALGTGRPVSAWELMQSNLGNDISLPSDKIADAFYARQKLLSGPQPIGHFVVDKPFRVHGESAFESMGESISRILFTLQERESVIESEENATFADNEVFDIRKNIEAFSKQIRGMLVAAAQQSNGESSLAIIDGYVRQITQRLSEEMLDETYKRAKKDAITTRKADAARLKEAGQKGYAAVFGGTPPPLDDFSRLQAAFTKEIFATLEVPQILMRVSRGTFDTPVFSGAWRDNQVDGLLVSLNKTDNIGQKRAKIELFINSLPERIRSLDLSALPEDRQKKLRALGYAFYELATERRTNRLNIEDTRSKETARLLEMYGEKFGVLVRRGIIASPPSPWPHPEREPDEDDESYNARLVESAKLRELIQRERKEKERLTQDKEIMKQLDALIDLLDTERDLDNFVGTLGAIIGKKGKELKQALKERAASYTKEGGSTSTHERNPRIVDYAPYVVYDEKRKAFVQPPEKMRDELTKMNEDLSHIEEKMGSLNQHAQTLESRVITDPNPSDIAAALRVHESEFVKTVVQPLAELYVKAEKYRKAPTATTRLQWKAGSFMVAHLHRAMAASSEIRERIQRVEIGERIRSYIADLKAQLAEAKATDPRPEAQEGFRDFEAQIALWETELNKPDTVLNKQKLDTLARAVTGE